MAYWARWPQTIFTPTLQKRWIDPLDLVNHLRLDGLEFLGYGEECPESLPKEQLKKLASPKLTMSYRSTDQTMFFKHSFRHVYRVPKCHGTNTSLFP